MAACSFTIDMNDPAPVLVKTMKGKMEAQGGNFAGDEAAGSFSISLLGSAISGSYTILGQQINFVIDNKPFFVGCSQIQNYLKENL
jgi:hypothetical protein